MQAESAKPGALRISSLLPAPSLIELQVDGAGAYMPAVGSGVNAVCRTILEHSAKSRSTNQLLHCCRAKDFDYSTLSDVIQHSGTHLEVVPDLFRLERCLLPLIKEITLKGTRVGRRIEPTADGARRVHGFCQASKCSGGSKLVNWLFLDSTKLCSLAHSLSIQHQPTISLFS